MICFQKIGRVKYGALTWQDVHAWNSDFAAYLRFAVGAFLDAGFMFLFQGLKYSVRALVDLIKLSLFRFVVFIAWNCRC